MTDGEPGSVAHHVDPVKHTSGASTWADGLATLHTYGTGDSATRRTPARCQVPA